MGYTVYLFDIALENGMFSAMIYDDLPRKNGEFPWLC